MMRVLALAAATGLLAACVRQGSSPVEPELWRLPDYSYATECTPERAVHVKLADLAADLARYHRTCVTVDGLLTSDSLYQSYDTLYRNTDPVRQRERFATHGAPRNPEIIMWVSYEYDLDLSQISPATVTGYPVSCELLYREFDAEIAAIEATAIAATGKPSGSLFWLGGPCHSPIFDQHLKVTHLVLPPRTRLWRMLPPDAGNDDGNLRPAAASWPHAGRVRKAAGTFLEAVRSRDDGRICRLLYPEDEDGCSDEWEQDDLYAAKARSSRDNTFSDLVLKQEVQDVVLVPHSAEVSEVPAVEVWVEAIYCMCAIEDCSRLWPIDRADIGLENDRPYACVAISFDPNADDATYFGLVASDFGLDEPEWTAAP